MAGGQCRRCLCNLCRRVSSCSPGCASTVSLRGTELDLGLVTMGSEGTNHDGSSSVRRGSSGSLQGSVECRDASDDKGARQRRGRAVVVKAVSCSGARRRCTPVCRGASQTRLRCAAAGRAVCRWWLGSVGARLGEAQ